MAELYKKYLYWLLCSSASVFLVAFIVFDFFLSKYYYPVYLLVFVFFIIITGIMHYILLKASNLRPAKFNNYFMLATILKLLIYLVFMSIYLYLHPGNAVPFLIVFFINYIFYSAFESVFITRQIRNK
ncbi:MAG: hypothetical protein NTW49_11595 [Bacteroidia bacterium]|nr:hypothetical protein [Bacteroidia bacterium]